MFSTFIKGVDSRYLAKLWSILICYNKLVLVTDNEIIYVDYLAMTRDPGTGPASDSKFGEVQYLFAFLVYSNSVVCSLCFEPV